MCNQLGFSESSYKTENCVHPASCHHYDGARQGFRERGMGDWLSYRCQLFQIYTSKVLEENENCSRTKNCSRT